ncbi:flavin reductase family protein [Micromonospora echinofusca]|uniref:Flavin reductase n=1 Tax=Micromonospora echinofusca TaxID=47858 RepID=A0ABS3VMK4_MICEH|nr:flavin reductase family protein [Micromonospora echinofusca]MBO4205763.1 flavin reductase [Micromonospora echinofusca]
MTTVDSPATPDLRTIDPDLFRAVLRRQAATVTVVTAPGSAPVQGPPVPPVGFTATSFTSVSLDPPLVSFCLDRSSSSWPTVRRAGYLAVHLLAADQQEVARNFATSGIDRFAGYPDWHPGPYDVPLLDRALAWLVCRTVDRVPAGDHALVIAEPLLAGATGGTLPLLYHSGAYATTAVGGSYATTGSADGPGGQPVSGVPRRPAGW